MDPTLSSFFQCCALVAMLAVPLVLFALAVKIDERQSDLTYRFPTLLAYAARFGTMIGLGSLALTAFFAFLYLYLILHR